MRAIQQSSQFNTHLRMAKWADPFPDTCWNKITLCKYVGYKFPPHHFPIQYQFIMPVGWCMVFVMTRLKLNMISSCGWWEEIHRACQSGTSCISAQRSPGAAKSEPRRCVTEPARAHARASTNPSVFLLSLCLLCVCLLLCVLVCVCQWFLWFLSRFSSDISGLD